VPLSRGPSDPRCTCPPTVDVMRGRAGETRYPCPIHPEPDLSGITFLPAIDFSTARINTEPLAFDGEVTDA
jgi:hypothetical protein